MPPGCCYAARQLQVSSLAQFGRAIWKDALGAENVGRARPAGGLEFPSVFISIPLPHLSLLIPFVEARLTLVAGGEPSPHWNQFASGVAEHSTTGADSVGNHHPRSFTRLQHGPDAQVLTADAGTARVVVGVTEYGDVPSVVRVVDSTERGGGMSRHLRTAVEWATRRAIPGGFGRWRRSIQMRPGADAPCSDRRRPLLPARPSRQ